MLVDDHVAALSEAADLRWWTRIAVPSAEEQIWTRSLS
jgi:hypothetical protein